MTVVGDGARTNVTVGMRSDKHAKRSMMQRVDTSLATRPRADEWWYRVLVQMPRGNRNVDGNINGRSPDGGRRNIKRNGRGEMRN